MDAFEAYLSELSANRAAETVPENSGYGALSTLVNEVGHKLKPRVRCVLNPPTAAPASPTWPLLRQPNPKGEPTAPGQLPARGALEAKAPSADVAPVAQRPGRRYLGLYRQVLVTNYRDFVLVGTTPRASAPPRTLLAGADEADFWTLAASPAAAAAHGERSSSSCAPCCARRTSPRRRTSPGSSPLRPRGSRPRRGGRRAARPGDAPAALEEALGLAFEGERGEHFFRSTLVQTLFYGIFAAWVLWSKQQRRETKRRFRGAGRLVLHVPMISRALRGLAPPGSSARDLVEVLDWAGAALNRVDRATFFAAFEEGHAVQYFYEPFLEAFDPELRKQLGVWYTPPEIVRYMVARVDRVLRDELGIADGLADPRVVVLDPCCGTGAYLVDVLGNRRRHARERRGCPGGPRHQAGGHEPLFGFEILPAPFVVAHLQLGLRCKASARRSPTAEERGAST